MKLGWLVSLATTILATVGVSAGSLKSTPQAILIAGAALVVATQIWQHHKTLRNADELAVQTKQQIGTNTITTLINDVRNDVARVAALLAGVRVHPVPYTGTAPRVAEAEPDRPEIAKAPQTVTGY